MKKFDFSGYATKNDIKCTDGRVIRHGAFEACDGVTVPLVWQHGHSDPGNVLGHALLEARDDGTYAYALFNETDAGQNAKSLVMHGDIVALSIYANGLVQKGVEVVHGAIRELSLVLAGANPGALIDNINMAHGDGTTTELEDEAIIFTGLGLQNGDGEDIEHADGGETVGDVFNSLSEKQKSVVYAMIAELMSGDDSAEHSAVKMGAINELAKGGMNLMKNNVFDQSQEAGEEGAFLSHDQFAEVVADAKKTGSFREALLAHAGDYGIDNIDYLFPDAKSVTPTPEMIQREMSWVSGVINGTRHSPFSRIKSLAADITPDEARAKGYVTGDLKKEEVFALLKRITTPKTIYKKQKLDRDDIVDITDMDVVAWLKMEMRMMLDEELARAILISDGREVDDDDKIDEDHIRPIYTDDEMYSHKVQLAEATTDAEMIDAFVSNRKYYKGSGNPTLFTDTDTLTTMLLLKDSLGRRLYNTQAELASALRVSKIVEVEVMEDQTRDVEGTDYKLIGILVNLKDYVVGADKGGAVNFFDDFDIDYNQYKYLLEARVSGALIKPKSALVFEIAQAAG